MASGPDLYARIVDAVNAVFGRHPRTRALHAKGVWCRATFVPAPDAARLCRAPHFAGDPVPATVRFSNASGDPESHDAERDGRGMAVKLHLADGSETDILATMAPSFATRTPEDFLELMRLRAPDPQTGEPDMAGLGAFLAAHPESQAAIQAVLGSPPPASYATIAYHSPHAFGLADADGKTTWARYTWRPQAGEERLDDDEARARGRDYLQRDLRERLESAPVTFDLLLRLARDDDPLEDATSVWPGEREVVVAGTLAIEEMVADPEARGELVVFDPTRVTDGIEMPDDPILHARPRAYSVSIERRAG